MSKFSGASAPYSISQNFLTSAKSINRLLALTDINSRDLVLEIGCGKGHITRELARICREVRGYEIDPVLCQTTREKLADARNAVIHRQDFLRCALPQKEQYKVFANIPFSITSDIVRKLTNAQNPPSDAWLVMEKGAAKRFSGKPHDTAASLRLKPYFEMRVVYHLARSDFHPAPAVDAVLLHIKAREHPDLERKLSEQFARFVECGRKHGVTSMLTKKQISTALRLADLPQIAPSGNMLYVQWLCLFRCSRRFAQK